MTTIAARRRPDGTWDLAADSQETHEDKDGGDMKLTCQKLFRKEVRTDLAEPPRYEGVILATAGDSTPGEIFVAHYGSPDGIPDLSAYKFDILILRRSGLYHADQHNHPKLIDREFYAIGCGAKVAFALMHAGLSAKEAVRITAIYDPYTGGDITKMSL